MGLTRREALSSIATVGGEKALKDALAVLGLGPSSHRRPQPLKLKSGLGQGTRVRSRWRLTGCCTPSCGAPCCTLNSRSFRPPCFSR